MQKEIDEIKEQENRSLWHDSPYQSFGQHKRTPRELLHGPQNLAVCRPRIATFTRVTNNTMAPEVQTNLSSEVQWLWIL
jgi:hypothetical protein